MLTPLDTLRDEVIDALIAEHWREIRGLLKEKKRRQQTVSDTNKESLDNRHRDGRAP